MTNRRPTHHLPAPSQMRLHELFDYSIVEGALYWKERVATRIKHSMIAGWPGPRGYFYMGVDGVRYRRHRLVWSFHHGDPGSMQIDHINGIRGDDRIENLRLATCLENQQNRGLRVDNTSGHRGVYWMPAYRKWRVKIQIHRKTLHIGQFDRFEDAVAARLAAEARYFGEFAPTAITSPQP